MSRPFVLVLGALLSGVAHGAHAQHAIWATQHRGVDSVLLERTRCFGRCPAYSVLLTTRGIVRFWAEGKTGPPTASDSVGAPAFMIVWDDAWIGKIMTLPNDIEQSPLCTNPRTDAPYAILTLFTTQGSKRVVDYLGCDGVPSELRDVEVAIDARTRVNRWIH